MEWLGPVAVLLRASTAQAMLEGLVSRSPPL